MQCLLAAREAARMSDSTAGSCLCGAIALSAALPGRWVAHCHCTRCQRAHGAAFVTWVAVDAGKAVIVDPNAQLRWFAATGAGERGFCARCGSSMFFRSEGWPGELHIARALFTAPIDKAPQMHGFYDTHVEWVQVADDLPRKADPAAGSP
jgi:hypothetical protein